MYTFVIDPMTESENAVTGAASVYTRSLVQPTIKYIGPSGNKGSTGILD